jgi:hypothetical protein
VQSPRHMSEGGRKVGEGSTKPPGFTTPHYFYIYNISLDDFIAIPDYQSVYLLICIGVSVQIGSRIRVFASTGQGLFKKKSLSGSIPCGLPDNEVASVRAPTLTG